MLSVKPSKPELFAGRRDALAVNTWLYQVEIYLNIVQASNPQNVIDDNMKVSFATTLLKGNAANWWYMLVENGTAPGQWLVFKNEFKKEFIPQDSIRRCRENLRRLHQTTSVSSYLNEFRNIVIGIPGMNEDEKLDRFCAGLKPHVRLEVLKSNPSDLQSATQIALNVDNAIFGAGMYSFQNNVQTDAMEIGNFQQKNRFAGPHSRRDNKQNTTKFMQRQKDIANNACFTCHKPGCRPWKHETRKAENMTPNNLNMEMESDSDADSTTEVQSEN